MKELICRLRSRGWRVVIVTASPTWIVEPGARLLGLGPEDIFGIEVCYENDETASIDSTNVEHWVLMRQ